jgi:DNA-binding response OmpR family regulator
LQNESGFKKCPNIYIALRDREEELRSVLKEILEEEGFKVFEVIEKKKIEEVSRLIRKSRILSMSLAIFCYFRWNLII